ncbi:MAG: hypothetical protein KJO31_12015 [Gammaproteobacteria bacterium]|nr:hypothetical protein [Gammaproteobacteria bacterium]
MNRKHIGNGYQDAKDGELAIVGRETHRATVSRGTPGVGFARDGSELQNDATKRIWPLPHHGWHL